MATNFAPSQLACGRRPVAISEEFFEVAIRVACFHTILTPVNTPRHGLPNVVTPYRSQTPRRTPFDAPALPRRRVAHGPASPARLLLAGSNSTSNGRSRRQ
eukprot:5048675-Prymnesium_polylepis.1